MNTKQIREWCEKHIVPLVNTAIEAVLIDIHGDINTISEELIRIGQRLDDIDTHLCRDIDEE